MEPLKLAVFDAEDLAVVSAHLQDALVRVGDLAYLPRERRFALLAQRHEFDGTESGPRRPAGLHFERVLSVKTLGVDRTRPDAELTLLAVTFEPSENPSGLAWLHFEGGARIQLEVECIEALMRDLDAGARAPADAGRA